MNAEQAFEELIETLARRAAGGGMGCRVDVGTVKDVDMQEGTCTVERDGKPELHEVRLHAVIDEKVKDYFRVIPAIGSYVMVLQMGMAEGLVVATSKIEKVEIKTGNVMLDMSAAGIVMNGGELGGMIDIAKLTGKVNELVDAFNGHTHEVSTTGSAAAQTGTAAVIASKAKKLDRGDYEDERVKH
nr:MAG TPA: hypothetical protein [Caudoviricetes sp.]